MIRIPALCTWVVTISIARPATAAISDQIYDDVRTIVEQVIEAEVSESVVERAACKAPALLVYYPRSLQSIFDKSLSPLKDELRTETAGLIANFVMANILGDIRAKALNDYLKAVSDQVSLGMGTSWYREQDGSSKCQQSIAQLGPARVAEGLQAEELWPKGPFSTWCVRTELTAPDASPGTTGDERGEQAREATFWKAVAENPSLGQSVESVACAVAWSVHELVVGRAESAERFTALAVAEALEAKTPAGDSSAALARIVAMLNPRAGGGTLPEVALKDAAATKVLASSAGLGGLQPWAVASRSEVLGFGFGSRLRSVQLAGIGEAASAGNPLGLILLAFESALGPVPPRGSSLGDRLNEAADEAISKKDRSKVERAFIISLVSYAYSATQPNGLSSTTRSAFRSAAIDLVRSSGKQGGFDRSFGSSALFPALAFRFSSSPAYLNEATQPGFRYVASVDWLRVRLHTRTASVYTTATFSFVDLIGPLAEVALRKRDAAYQYSDRVLWDFLCPRLDLAVGIPSLSDHLTLGAGVSFRTVVPFVDDGTVTYRGWWGHHGPLGKTDFYSRFVELSGAIRYEI